MRGRLVRREKRKQGLGILFIGRASVDEEKATVRKLQNIGHTGCKLFGACPRKLCQARFDGRHKNGGIFGRQVFFFGENGFQKAFLGIVGEIERFSARVFVS